MYIRAIECDREYLLGPAPDYIDPIYFCLREISRPIIDLIDAGEVPAPSYPSLEQLRSIEAEVFFVVGRDDHVTPYRLAMLLGDYIPRYEGFVPIDNHSLTIQKDVYPELRRAFFKYGLGSPELSEVKERVESMGSH